MGFIPMASSKKYPSYHVLRALGLSEAATESSIRFSFGRFTTDDEVEQAAGFVMETLEALATAGMGQTAPEKAVPVKNLGTAIHKLFKPSGNVELGIPPREPRRKPPGFGRDD